MTCIRILYADTDLAGVVYHANYLRFFEQARTEQLYGLGVDVAAVQNETGVVFTISEASIRYHAPARYGDEICIEVLPVQVGPARCTLAYEARHGPDGPLVATGATTFAAIELATGKIVRLPPTMRAQLEAALRAREAAEQSNGAGATGT